VYPCSGDRWCAIAVFTDAEWLALVRVIGAPPWTHDPRFATVAGRKQHEEELDKHLRSWTRSHRPDELTRIFQDAGVPAGEVARGEELLDWDPQLTHRGFWQTLEHPEIGPYRAPAHAFRLADALCEMRPAPTLGQHTAEVLQEILGLSESEISRLTSNGVLA
jgi:benzylsuccinate CoA-transferase BbsF subunit